VSGSATAVSDFIHQKTLCLPIDVQESRVRYISVTYVKEISLDAAIWTNTCVFI